MSRHTLAHNDITYVYGYDNPLQEYFMQKSGRTVVGTMSKPKVYGSAVNLMIAMQHEGIFDLIPQEHRRAIGSDLPLPEAVAAGIVIARPACPDGVNEFNTGRTYTAEGQVIRWVSSKEQQATLFHDCSRGITGAMQKYCATSSDLMALYDEGAYVYPAIGANRVLIRLGLK